MTDEQKADRKALIANNKEWDAAETVRREWLAAFLSRKTLPKDAIAVIASGLASARLVIANAMGRGNSMAATLLAVENVSGGALVDLLQAHPARCLHVALAIVLGGVEENTSRESWRTPRSETAWYLRTLAEWGYPLTPIERTAARISE
jgi:ParB family chromosome partitioning protein